MNTDCHVMWYSKDKIGWEDGSVGKGCASQTWNLTSIPRLHEKVEEENRLHKLPSGLHIGATGHT